MHRTSRISFQMPRWRRHLCQHLGSRDPRSCMRVTVRPPSGRIGDMPGRKPQHVGTPCRNVLASRRSCAMGVSYKERPESRSPDHPSSPDHVPSSKSYVSPVCISRKMTAHAMDSWGSRSMATSSGTPFLTSQRACLRPGSLLSFLPGPLPPHPYRRPSYRGPSTEPRPCRPPACLRCRGR